MEQHVEIADSLDVPGLKFYMSISTNQSDVGLVGECVNKVVSKYLNDDEAAGYELCVVEVLNNVIEHGVTAGSASILVVELELFDDRIEVQIQDDGSSIPIRAFQQATAFDFDPKDTDKLPEGGMGLFIVTSFMNDVTYETDEYGQNRLRMTRHLNK